MVVYLFAAMDFFLAACQGLGLALAAGALGGALGRRGTLGTVLLIVAVVAGAALFGISLAAEDHPAWPGWPLGAALAGFSFFVDTRPRRGRREAGRGRGVHRGPDRALPRSRSPGSRSCCRRSAWSPSPALLWLFAGQRRRATQKYEGLRTLR